MIQALEQSMVEAVAKNCVSKTHQLTVNYKCKIIHKIDP